MNWRRFEVPQRIFRRVLVPLAHVFLAMRDGVNSATVHHAFEFGSCVGTFYALRFAPPTHSAWPSSGSGY
jgi:hypothetical protein